jgi:hypothetical protein
VLGVLDGVLSRLPDLAPAFEAAARRRAIAEMWHGHLMQTLEVVVNAISAQGIAVAALKGPVLADRLYSPHATRHCVDLDLLVRESDLDGAIDALLATGYVCETGPAAEYSRRHGHHVRLTKIGGPPIELHFCAYAGFGVVLPAAALLDRAGSFRLPAGATVLVSSPADEFIYLATHAAGHSFIRLMWLYDLKLLVARHPSMDWSVVAARARALDVEAPVAYAAWLLQSWLGVETATRSNLCRRRPVRTWLADGLLNEVSTPQVSSARDNLGGLLFTSLLCDRSSAGARLLQRHLLRSARRRLKRLAPRYLPDRWSA